MNVEQFKIINNRGGNLRYREYDGDKPNDIATRFGGIVETNETGRLIKIHGEILTFSGLNFLLEQE